MTNCRPIQTRFPCGYSPEGLNRAIDGNSPGHYAKGTPSPCSEEHRAPTACRRVVSGSFDSPKRGSFHRSLALLSSIGRQVVLSLRRWASQIQTGFHVTGLTRVLIGRLHRFRVRDCHPLWSCVPAGSSNGQFCNFTVMSPTTPPCRSRTV